MQWFRYMTAAFVLWGVDSKYDTNSITITVYIA